MKSDQCLFYSVRTFVWADAFGLRHCCTCPQRRWCLVGFTLCVPGLWCWPRSVQLLIVHVPSSLDTTKETVWYEHNKKIKCVIEVEKSTKPDARVTKNGYTYNTVVCGTQTCGWWLSTSFVPAAAADHSIRNTAQYASPMFTMVSTPNLRQNVLLNTNSTIGERSFSFCFCFFYPTSSLCVMEYDNIFT